MITITESWLNHKIKEADLNNPNFIFYRQDRPAQQASRGGGVLIEVNKKLISGICKTLDFNNSNYEQLYMSVIKKGCRFILGTAYFPKPSLINFHDYSMFIQDITDVYLNYKYIFLGDYNLPKALWQVNNDNTIV